ncbi:MAG: YihY/virulence factor BrkB family protein [Thermoleophilaceae bacterium]|nr:YihY/virulence factor BrkB family protein [Thermoleophilaceae bacterium]
MSIVTSPARVIGQLRAELSALTLAEFAKGIVHGYRERGLLVLGGAIAFRLALALIPLSLCALGAIGFFGFDEIWTADLSPRLAASTSPAAFTVVDDTVELILGQGQIFWVTVGALFALWQASGVVREVMKSLNDVYEIEEDRSLRVQFAISVALAFVLIVLILGAIAAIQFGGAAGSAVLGSGGLPRTLGATVGWIVGLSLLVVAIGLLVRAGPDHDRPLQWVTGGALLSVLLWVAMSALVGFYLTNFADYGSIFGNLATAFVLLEYLFLSVMSLLTGLLLDALAFERLESRA